jgi:protein-S-isoprenylcysteine O-methyltransferase Ste14
MRFGPGTIRLTAAVLLGLAGVGLLAWSAAVLGWRRWLDLADAPLEPESPPLVLRGPFGVIRHPQTLALLLLLAGASTRWPRPGLWVLALIAATIILGLAASEEPRLAKRFGTAYRRYQRAVPFLLPRWW